MSKRRRSWRGSAGEWLHDALRPLRQLCRPSRRNGPHARVVRATAALSSLGMAPFWHGTISAWRHHGMAPFRHLAITACCPLGTLPSRHVTLSACCPFGMAPSRQVAITACCPLGMTPSRHAPRWLPCGAFGACPLGIERRPTRRRRGRHSARAFGGLAVWEDGKRRIGGPTVQCRLRAGLRRGERAARRTGRETRTPVGRRSKCAQRHTPVSCNISKGSICRSGDTSADDTSGGDSVDSG